MDALFEMPREAYRLRRCPVCGGTLAQTHRRHGTDPVFTYLMQRQGWVKIGKSYQPETRRKVLSMPSPGCRVICPEEMDWAEPIVTIRLIAGDSEHELHERFAACHVAGEWFLPNTDMRDWIRRCT